MSSSDIYQVNESPWNKPPEKKSANSFHRRRRSSEKTFDETVNEDLSKTHRRRRRNSGVRRFRHQMKKPEYNKKFWITTLSVGVGILVFLIVWDSFFRYPNQTEESSETPVFQIEID